MNGQENILILDSVSRVYGKGRTEIRAVDGVGFAAAAGETVLIMGPSGSGKTTLLNLLDGLDRPTSGRVTLRGTDMAGLAPAEANEEKVFDIFRNLHSSGKTIIVVTRDRTLGDLAQRRIVLHHGRLAVDAYNGHAAASYT